MKVPKEAYEGNILRGNELEDMESATIVEVGTVVFDKGKDSEHESFTLTVNVEGMSDPKSFTLNRRFLKLLVDNFGEDTDKWNGNKIKVFPQASTTPDGKPTTVVGVMIPKKK